MSDIKKVYINNEEGKKMYEKTMLRYSKMIIVEIKKNPNRLPYLLKKLNMTNEEFKNLISGKEIGNVSFYDTSLEFFKNK